MPTQLPAGGPGAEAPREQPASPTTDDAPPPAKQEYTGAQGAEIAGSADSASAGPGASDSLVAQQSTMAATASTRATTVDHPGQHHMELRSQVSVGGGRSSDNQDTESAMAAAALNRSTEPRAPPIQASASPSAAEPAPASPRPASALPGPALPSPATPASCADGAALTPVHTGFEPPQNAPHHVPPRTGGDQLKQVGHYLLGTLAQGPGAAPPSRAAATPLPAASSTSAAAAAHLCPRFGGGAQGQISHRVDPHCCDQGGLGQGPRPADIKSLVRAGAGIPSAPTWTARSAEAPNRDDTATSPRRHHDGGAGDSANRLAGDQERGDHSSVSGGETERRAAGEDRRIPAVLPAGSAAPE